MIDVSTEGLSDGQTVTATVELGGFDRECGLVRSHQVAQAP